MHNNPMASGTKWGTIHLASAVLCLAGTLGAQSIEQHMDQGVALLQAGKFAEAAGHFVQVLAINPKLAEAHYLLGLIRQERGDRDAAVASYRTALRIDPRYAQAQSRLAETLTFQARARDGGWEEAIAACRRAILLDPQDPDPRFHLAWLLSKQGNAAASIGEYQTLLKLAPKYPGARLGLAMAYLDSRNPAPALPLLQALVADEPRNASAHHHLGSAYSKTGDCRQAAAALERAAELDPRYAQTYYLLGGCYKQLGRTEDSVRALSKFQELRKGADGRMQAKFLAAAAHRQAQAGQWDEAIASYREALAASRDRSIAIDLSVALLKKGDAAAVVELLQADKEPLALYQLALAYTALQQPGKAQQALDRALSVKPDLVEAIYQKGVLAAQAGEHTQAEALFRHALAMRPDSSEMRRQLIRYLEASGKKAEAESERRLLTGLGGAAGKP
jgi:tetratricopeptide (TPR) repeat protein